MASQFPFVSGGGEGLAVLCPKSGASIRAARISSSLPNDRPALPADVEDSFLILLQLNPLPGAVFITHLPLRPVWMMNSAFDVLAFILPRKALNAVAQEHNSRSIAALRCPGGQVDEDALRLAACLLPALQRNNAPPLFADHVVLALRAHIAQRYGETQLIRRNRGGLSPRQERLAKELLMASIQTGAEIADISQAIGLSRSHFIRAFRDSVGEPPHRWLTLRKIEEARKLLAESDLPLTDIALTCGFSDQSHFTRVFSRISGLPPGIWRHNQDGEILRLRSVS